MPDARTRQHRLFVTVQITTITATLVAGALSYVIPRTTNHDQIFGLIRFFDVGIEANFPTYISTVNLLVAAGLCYLIYKAAVLQSEQPSRRWLLLSAIFVYLSADEAAQIHELLGRLRVFFPESDLVQSRHNWLFAGTLLASVLGLSMLPFLFHLPKELAISFLLAGCVFALGTIGMEFAGSLMMNRGVNPDDLAYQLRRLLEEALEMYGIVIFNCAAARELAKRAAAFKLVVSNANASALGRHINR